MKTSDSVLLPVEDVSRQARVDVSQERRQQFVAERKNKVAPVARQFCLERDVTIEIHLSVHITECIIIQWSTTHTVVSPPTGHSSTLLANYGRL